MSKPMSGCVTNIINAKLSEPLGPCFHVLFREVPLFQTDSFYDRKDDVVPNPGTTSHEGTKSTGHPLF